VRAAGNSDGLAAARRDGWIFEKGEKFARRREPGNYLAQRHAAAHVGAQRKHVLRPHAFHGHGKRTI